MNTTGNHILGKGLGMLAILVSLPALAAEGERHISLQQDIAAAELVRIEVPAGQLEIVGISGTEVIAEVTAVCQEQDDRACLKLLADLAWQKKTGSIAEFMLMPASITEFNQVMLKVKIGVPRDKALAAHLSAGELSISDTSGCLNADLNAGQINITLAEDELASAQLSATVGDVKLATPKNKPVSGHRSLLVGAQIDWNKGTGSCHAKASVLAGEAKLTVN